MRCCRDLLFFCPGFGFMSGLGLLEGCLCWRGVCQNPVTARKCWVDLQLRQTSDQVHARLDLLLQLLLGM